MFTYVVDDLTGERREGTQADLARFTRLVDALPEIDTHWPSPQTSDVDAHMMPLVMQATCLRNTSKHIQDEIRSPELVEPILAMYEAASGAPLRERPVFSVTNCTIAPLQHDREMTEASLKLTKRGVPIFVLPMPQAGTTGPMTLLGTCIVHFAELLSAVVLFQLSQPGCPVVSGVGSAVADMRSGGYLAASPEIGLINMICLEMSRFYGLLTQATGISADSPEVDFQAGSEGGMTGLCAALAGADSLIAVGRLRGRAGHQSRQDGPRRRPGRRPAPLHPREPDRRDDGADRRHRRGRHRRPLPGTPQHARRTRAPRSGDRRCSPRRRLGAAGRRTAAAGPAAAVLERAVEHARASCWRPTRSRRSTRPPSARSTRSWPRTRRGGPDEWRARRQRVRVTRPTISYLSDADRAFVHEQIVRVLEDVGIGYNTPEAIELLAEAGAPVDRERLTAQASPGSSSSAVSRRARSRSCSRRATRRTTSSSATGR